MPDINLAKSERRELADLLDEVGPDAPTLCEGWTTLDLAAHLVVRERRPDSGPGLVMPALAAWTERVRQTARARGYETLVAQFRAGPPPFSPFVLFDRAANSTEYFIHHEDVRRAGPAWEPRALTRAIEGELWGRLKRGSRLVLRRSPVGVVLELPDGTSHAARPGDEAVRVVGAAAELTLFFAGRKDAARVEVRGEPGVVARFDAVRFGV